MRLAIVLLYTTGMPIGELVRLTLQDIENGGRRRRIPLSIWRLEPATPACPTGLVGSHLSVDDLERPT
jgi:integrase